MRYDKHRVDHKFHVKDHVCLHLSKERLQGLAKKLKPIRYGPFEITDQVNEKAFKLNLSKYMNIYSVVNVKHIKLYDPSMLIEDEVDSD